MQASVQAWLDTRDVSPKLWVYFSCFSWHWSVGQWGNPTPNISWHQMKVMLSSWQCCTEAFGLGPNSIVSRQFYYRIWPKNHRAIPQVVANLMASIPQDDKITLCALPAFLESPSPSPISALIQSVSPTWHKGRRSHTQVTVEAFPCSPAIASTVTKQSIEEYCNHDMTSQESTPFPLHSLSSSEE